MRSAFTSARWLLPVSYVAQLAAVAVVYFLAARLSLALAIPPGYATAIWPPSGIALAAALVLGPRVWPGVWLGAALANVGVESSTLAAVFIASGNTLEAIVGSALIRLHAGDPGRFERAEHVFKFIGLCAVAAAIAATVATLALAAGHSLSWAEGLRNWWTWWQGDLSGMIIAAPLILSWVRRDAPAPRRIEALSFAALLAAAAFALGTDSAAPYAPLTLTFMTLPFIIWGAFRFGQREVSTAIAVICAVAVRHTLDRPDLFAPLELNEWLLLLLTFNAIVVTTGLTLVAVVGERTRAMGDLSRTHAELERQIRNQKHYDPLTGLGTAALFRDQLAQLLSVASESSRKVAVAIVDIERFKIINDTFGRPGGDELLRQIAARLAANASPSTIVARVGDDRFAVAAHGFESEQAVAAAVRVKLAEWFGAPYSLRKNELRLSAQLGLALFPDDGVHPDVLYMHAEAALKKAKASAERFLFYRQAMSERVAEKFSLENKLRRAIEREEFVLHYQLKVQVDSRRPTGLEALIRWNSPDLGLVPPMQFVPLLEQTGLIAEVGSWSLRRAVLDQRRWAARGLDVPRVAVNVSSLQLRQQEFVERLQEAIDLAAGAQMLDLEITESHIMEDVAANIERLRTIRALGVGIAIDDFGTGYSSLAYLAKLPAQVLKIDRSFTARMLEDDDAMALVQTILSLANTLKLTAVAEGVESEEQADVLHLLRCHEMQGYLIGRPVPFDEVTALLERYAREK